MARRHDFDLVLAGDFRARGEAGAVLASHLDVLAGRGLAIGLYWLRDPALPPAATVEPRLAELVRRHAAAPIEPVADPLRCRLLLVHRPELAEAGFAAGPPLRADAAVFLADRPEAVAAAEPPVATRSPPLWCPANPAARAACEARGLPVHAEDVGPCERLEAWRVGRGARTAARCVVGRTTLPASDEPGLEWRAPQPGSPGLRRFLAGLDLWLQEPGDPPRLALRAMATGRVVLAAPELEPALGPGPAYAPPAELAATARRLGDEPAAHARHLAGQDATLAERFGPGPLLRLVAPHLRRRRVPARAAAPRRRRRAVVLYPTNGVGLGHVARLLALARRLPPESFEPVFYTPCHALAVIEHAGYRAEHVAEPAHDETAPADHARAMAPRLLAALRYHDPAAVVFDGNVPREALLAACAEIDAPLVWVRRGMWRADPNLARHLALSHRFAAVIEPGEAAAEADRGATARAADGPVPVPPVMLTEPADLLPRAAARRALGLPPDGPAALVQLGSGSNRDVEGQLDRLVPAAAALGIELVVAEWLIRHNPVRRQGLRYLAAFPHARYFRAFDLSVSAAGYNAFHELLHHGVPTLFLPNDHHKVDDQRARATWAEARGAAICVPPGGGHGLRPYLAALLDPGVRRALRRRARAACPSNGAAAAAAALERVIALG